MARFGDLDTQYFDDSGDPLVSGKIYFYESGTTTLKNTYADVNYTIPNTNPVILTAAGRLPNVFFPGTAKAILATSAGTQIQVRDPVGDTATSFGNAWIASKKYNANDVVQGSDGEYYVSLVGGNVNNNPSTTTGSWTFLYSVEWSTGITYKEGSVVTYESIVYQSLQNANLNKNPSTQAAYWTPIQLSWISTQTYALDANVVASDGVLYTSIQAANTGNEPSASALWWVGTSAAAAASAVAAAASAADAAAQVVLAADEVALATAQVALAADEVVLATAQVALASGFADDSAASAVASAASAVEAAASAVASENFSGAAEWVSGTTYVLGDVVWSPIDYFPYRRIIAGAGTTDPSLDDTNWMAMASAGGIIYTDTKTANYTASENDGVLTNTTAGAFTITLPASPTNGMQVVIADADGTWGTNNLTVGRNSSNIAGVAQDLVLDISGASVQFVYNSSGTATWEVFAQIGGSGGSVGTLDGVQTLTNKTWNSDTIGVAYGGTGLTAAGTSGNVLTSDGTNWASSAAPTGGLTLLSTVTASASATVDIESTFDSTYDAYMLVVSGLVPDTDSVGLLARMKIGGSYDTEANYHGNVIAKVSINATVAGYTGFARTSINITPSGMGYSGNLAGQSTSFTMRIFHPASTSLQKTVSFEGVSLYTASPRATMFNGTGANTGTSALTGVQFFTSSGNITSGTFRLYGISNS